MADLMHMMSQLVDVKGKILIPGVMDSVAELTDAEKKLYDVIDFDKVQNNFKPVHNSFKPLVSCAASLPN